MKMCLLHCFLPWFPFPFLIANHAAKTNAKCQGRQVEKKDMHRARIDKRNIKQCNNPFPIRFAEVHNKDYLKYCLKCRKSNHHQDRSTSTNHNQMKAIKHPTNASDNPILMSLSNRITITIWISNTCYSSHCFSFGFGQGEGSALVKNI